MAGVTGPSIGGAIDLYTSTASPGVGLTVGQLVWDSNTGKAFRYVLAGASNLVVGNLLQESVEDTQFENMAVTATPINSKFLNVTNGTTTVTDANFRGGQISVYTAGGTVLNDEYTIMGVTGVLTSGGAMQVLLDRPLRVAATTSCTVNMKRSPYSGVIVAPTTQTGIPVGLAIYAITAAQYGWIQTYGPCTFLSDSSTYAVGSEVGTPCANTAGAPAVYAAGTTHCKVGYVRQAQASTHGIAGFLTLL